MRFILIFLFITVSFSKEITAIYKVDFGVFNDIGESKATITINNDKYKIKVFAKPKGIAALLSTHKYNSFESIGYIKNNTLIPIKYIEIIQKSKKHENIYTFDHKNKIVYKNGKKYKYYAKNDILSLYFNLKNIIKEHGLYNLKAIGGRRSDGLVRIEYPYNQKPLQKILHTKEGIFLKVFIYQKIFSSKYGELIIQIDPKTFFTKKAILQDVIFFGDIRGEMKKLEIKN